MEGGKYISTYDSINIILKYFDIILIYIINIYSYIINIYFYRN